MSLLNKNCFLIILKKFYKTPTKTSIKKRKRFINPLFLDKYRIADVSGKGICVACSKELAEESWYLINFKDTRKLMQILLSCQKRLSREFSIIVIIIVIKFNRIVGSFMQSSITEKKIKIFSYKTAFLIAQHKRPLTESETIMKTAVKSFVRYLKMNHLLERYMKL